MGQLVSSPSARFWERCKLTQWGPGSAESRPLNDVPVFRGLQAAYSATLRPVYSCRSGLNLAARGVTPTPRPGEPEISSAVTSSDVEYLSRSTSNWPNCYFVTSKSNARNCYSSKSKKSIQILKYFESKKVKVKVTIHRLVCFF